MFQFSIRINNSATFPNSKSKMSHPYRNPTEITVKVDDEQPNTHSIENRSKFSQITNVIRQSWESNGRLKFILIAIGIFVSFICHGMFMETLTRGCYGDKIDNKCPDDKKFKYPIAMVSVQMLCAFAAVKGNVYSIIAVLRV